MCCLYPKMEAKMVMRGIKKKTIASRLGISERCLYNKMKGKTFTEYIGTLYQDDITSNPYATHEEISDANKTRVRIITYVEQ